MSPAESLYSDLVPFALSSNIYQLPHLTTANSATKTFCFNLYNNLHILKTCIITISIIVCFKSTINITRCVIWRRLGCFLIAKVNVSIQSQKTWSTLSPLNSNWELGWALHPRCILNEGLALVKFHMLGDCTALWSIQGSLQGLSLPFMESRASPISLKYHF